MATRRRRLLLRALLQASATDGAAVVQVQLAGTSANNTAAIGIELGQVVANDNLAVRTAHRQLPGRNHIACPCRLG